MNRSKRIEQILLVTAALLLPAAALAGAFTFAGESNGVDVITHPTGYSGTGGELLVSVCIDPTSPNAAAMVIPVQNAVRTFNGLAPTTHNLLLGSENAMPVEIDFESAVLHEVGHCLGMAHPNLATESGLPTADREYTKSTDGANDSFDIHAGTDTVRGTSDDVRGDDDNLHWFRMTDNDPFKIDGTIDTSTYSRLTADLPAGHTFAANAGKDTAAVLLGEATTEAIMQQGQGWDEDQRALVPDDVATLKLAMAGLDEVAGTSDDYTLKLSYAGLTAACDVVIDFDDAETGFAVCKSSGTFLGGGHVGITSAKVYYNTTATWFFNENPNCEAPTANDFGRDGRTDLLLRHKNLGQTYLYELAGLSVLDSGYVPINSDLGWTMVGTGDTDGDGRGDILVRKASTGASYLYLMRERTVVASGALGLTRGLAWNVVGMGDFDGDRRADVLMRSGTSGKWFMYQLDGLAIDGSGWVALNSDLAWKPVGVADLDGDGRDDVVVRNENDGRTYVYFMNGQTVMSSGLLSVTKNLSWQVADLADINGDCRADVVLRNSTSGQTYAYLLDGLTVQSSDYLNVPTSLSLAVVGTGDIDGDGKADLMLRHDTTGATAAYLLDGLSVDSSAILGDVTTGLNWEVQSP